MLVGFFLQAEDGIRDLVRSRGLGDVYKRQVREGEVREEIVRAVSARPTRLLLIGAPRRETDKGPDPAASFAAWVQATTGVAVEIVAPLPTK